ncbi:MAG: tRNA (adenosine(37)-N6)-threonylcarbamoyltransferase complex ATPase subunit type 1 TsaE [Bacillota bacterium]
MPLTISSSSPEQTARVAAALASSLCGGDCLSLIGDLGAGKTQFVAGLASALGAHEPVHSPTFNLVNVYSTQRMPIYHADFYRLESEEELLAIGWEDYLDGRGLLLVEWGDRFQEALPLDCLQIELRRIDHNQRLLLVTASGRRSREIEEAWADALASS